MAKDKPELIRIMCRYVLLVKCKEKGIIWILGWQCHVVVNGGFLLLKKNVTVLSYKVNCADFQQSADFL